MLTSPRNFCTTSPPSHDSVVSSTTAHLLHSFRYLTCRLLSKNPLFLSHPSSLSGFLVSSSSCSSISQKIMQCLTVACRRHKENQLALQRLNFLAIFIKFLSHDYTEMVSGNQSASVLYSFIYSLSILLAISWPLYIASVLWYVPSSSIFFSLLSFGVSILVSFHTSSTTRG